MIKEFAESKSPHVVISSKTFNDIKLNVIMLTRPRIESVSKNRKIFYDIKYMVHNVAIKKKGTYHNLNPSSTKRNIIFILIAIHEISLIDNLVFFTEKGEMIPKSSLDEEKKHGFVMLATI